LQSTARTDAEVRVAGSEGVTLFRTNQGRRLVCVAWLGAEAGAVAVENGKGMAWKPVLSSEDPGFTGDAAFPIGLETAASGIRLNFRRAGAWIAEDESGGKSA
jgi:hypothetical protein